MKTKQEFFKVTKYLLALWVVFPGTVIADDTEIYFSEELTSTNPNILFVMDVSGSMKEIVPDSGGKTRLEVMKDAFKTVIRSAPSNINVGLTNYGELKYRDYATSPSHAPDEAHGIKFPVAPIDSFARPYYEEGYGLDTPSWQAYWWPDGGYQGRPRVETVRTWLPKMVDKYWSNPASFGNGYTPIVGALHEAALYYRGEAVTWGRTGGNIPKAHPATYAGPPIKFDREICDAARPWRANKFDFDTPANNHAGRTNFWYPCPSDWENPSGRGSASTAVGYCEASERDCRQTYVLDYIEQCRDGIPDDPATIPQSVKERACGVNEDGTLGSGREVLINYDYTPDSQFDCSTGVPRWPSNGPYAAIDGKPDGETLDLTGGEKDESGTCLTPGNYRLINTTKETCVYSICNGGLPTANYISPIQQSCQTNTNFIVLLSDGKPQYTHRRDEYNHLIDFRSLGFDEAGLSLPGWAYYRLLKDRADGVPGLAQDFDVTTCEDAPNGFPSGKCGPELTHFLSENDNISDDVMPGVQSIDTYVIGYALGTEPATQSYLRSLVTTDDPDTEDNVEGYYTAENAEELITSLGDIFRQIVGTTTTALASPGYGVSVKSGLSHENFVYIPVFDKGTLPLWSGNLKKFKLASVGSLRKIQGKNDLDAMDELGAFTDDAWDLWSNSLEADGKSIPAGGAAALLNPESRNLYSDLNCSADSTCDLTSSQNELIIANTADNQGITTGALGLASVFNTTYKKRLVCFIRGFSDYDETENECSGENRKHMGDMLHSEPVIVTYDKDYQDQTNKQVVFAATNEGYLHAFDTITGAELFGFMPKELLANINPQYLNNEIGGHRYGIDGHITTWIKDIDNDGVIESDEGDHVYLYFGLRRGGNSYYALDVTNPNSPQLLWKIEGGSGNFAHLGQSWSIPYLAKIHTSATDAALREVVIFSGGYDTNQDEDFGERNATDSLGDDIFIVDATSGDLIWSMKAGSGISGSDALTHSIPGGVRILDINRDGAVDRMYFADVAGNVWRLELDGDLYDDDESAFDLGDAKLIKFAELGGTNAAVDKRKFFNEPDVSVFKEAGKSRLMVSIGSGYRAHPIDGNINDRFYAMMDEHYLTPLPDDYTLIRDGSLVSVAVETRENDEGETVTVLASSLGSQTLVQAEERGWYLDLPEEREKVLANAVTSHGTVIFTTLVPQVYSEEGSNAAACSGSVTQGRLYALDITTAKITKDLNNSGGDPNIDDLYVAITANEIPGAVQLVFNEPVASTGSACSEGNCVQNVDIRSGKKLSQVLSYNAGLLESIFWSKPQKEE